MVALQLSSIRSVSHTKGTLLGGEGGRVLRENFWGKKKNWLERPPSVRGGIPGRVKRQSGRKWQQSKIA